MNVNTLENKKLNIVDPEIRQLKCFDENLYFKDLIIKCSNFSKNYVQKTLLFKKNNLFHILVKDSSKKKMTYKFYSLLSKFWSMELTDINQKDLNKDNQIITIEKNDAKIKFFLLALIKSLLVYLLVTYFFSILTFPNVKL